MAATSIDRGNRDGAQDLPRFKIVKCRKRFPECIGSDFYDVPPEKKMKRKKKVTHPNSRSYDYEFNLHFFPTSLHDFIYQEVSVHFKIEKPRYPTGIQRTPPLKLEIGKPLEVDIVTLLSNPNPGEQRDYLVRYDGTSVDVESVKGKHLLICCFFIPLVADSEDGQYCRAMIATYRELLGSKQNKKKKKFEMVMVAKMRSDLLVDEEDEKVAFDHFFSAFPCPAIPFSDVHSRDLVCHSLGLGMSSDHPQHTALVLDPNQNVLHTDACLFYDYGASSYPFTLPRIQSLKFHDHNLRCRLDVYYKCAQLDEPVHQDQVFSKSKPVPLNELLCSNSSIVLSKIGGDGGLDKISVPQLGQKKCVALYLCRDGEFASFLANFHQQCVKEKLEFEVVLVYLPFSGDPTCFISDAKLALMDCNVSSWWELPFIDHVSRRLWRLCDQPLDDGVIIWADGGEAGDLEGRLIISNGLPYPLTRKHILKSRLSQLKALTPVSLLEGTCSYLVHGDDKTMPLSVLEDKNVLLYFDWNDQVSDSKNKLLLNSYKKICEDYPGTQVVFVPVCKNDASSTSRDNVNYSISWPRLPIPTTQVLRLCTRFYQPPVLVAIGADGCICSTCAFDRLNPYGKVPLFADTLFQEIVDELAECNPLV